MNKVEVNKQTIVELWNSKCSSASDSSKLERSGAMLSLFINNDVSLTVFEKSIKVVFGGQIEYASEEISDAEVESLEKSFSEAENRIEANNREEIIRRGVNSLSVLLAKSEVM